jgi:HD-like signal output (HDOD) protein
MILKAADLRSKAPDDRAATIPAEPDFQTDSVTIPVKLCNLPPFSSIANQVIALSADPNIELKAIAAVIERDPAFAADILFLANSSLFGFPSRMHVLRHAVAVLGLDRIKALSITVAMRAFLSNGGPLVRECWRHSAACALIAEEISATFDFSGDRAYTAALMHDIGRLGLLKMYSKELTPVLRAEYEVPQEIIDAERAALMVDHGLAGAWLVKNWALPAAFAEVCEHHHDPLRAGDTGILALVKVACALANAIGFSAVRCRTRPTYQEITAALVPKIGKALPPQFELWTNIEARLRPFEY